MGPKFVFGTPTDVMNSKMNFLPHFIRKRLLRFTLWLVAGKMEDYGLPKPDHQPTESRPILNSLLLYHLRHGNIHPRGDVEKFDGNTVCFSDGQMEDYDTIIAATGYNIRFPFFDYPELDYSNRDVDLYLKVFHPKFPSLAIIGLTQPQGCIWPLSDTQSKLVANYIVGNYDWPNDIRKKIEHEIRQNKKRYLNTPRHSTEVDYHEFLGKLRKELPQNAPEWNN